MLAKARTWEQCPHMLADNAREKRQIDPIFACVQGNPVGAWTGIPQLCRKQGLDNTSTQQGGGPKKCPGEERRCKNPRTTQRRTQSATILGKEQQKSAATRHNSIAWLLSNANPLSWKEVSDPNSNQTQAQAMHAFLLRIFFKSSIYPSINQAINLCSINQSLFNQPILFLRPCIPTSVRLSVLPAHTHMHERPKPPTMRHKNIPYPKNVYPSCSFSIAITRFELLFELITMLIVSLWAAWHYLPNLSVSNSFWLPLPALNFSELVEGGKW